MAGRRSIHYLILLLGGIALLALAGCTTIDPAMQAGSSAEVYCQNLGHDTFAADGPDGEAITYCVFADGSACEQLDFFYGDCAPERSICSIMGLTLDHYTSPDGRVRYARCLFPDGTSCMAFDYALLGEKCQRVRAVNACADVPGGICP